MSDVDPIYTWRCGGCGNLLSRRRADIVIDPDYDVAIEMCTECGDVVDWVHEMRRREGRG